MALRPITSLNTENQILGCLNPLATNYREVQNPNGINPEVIIVEPHFWFIEGTTTKAKIWDTNQNSYKIYNIVESTPTRCQYVNTVEGCKDPLAYNYNSKATKSCVNCCTYVNQNINVSNQRVSEAPEIIQPACSLVGVTTKNYLSTQILVDSNGVDLSKVCCEKLASDYSMTWVYDTNTSKCFINDDFKNIDTTTNSDCLPVIFSLNEKPMGITCESELTINLWLYVGKPKKEECYNNGDPISARIKISDDTLNNNLTQINQYNANVSGFDTWVKLEATLPPTPTTVEFTVDIEFYAGLNCCCTYDIFVDNIEVLCNSQIIQTSDRLSGRDCPGFKLKRVIDNKKSWVYNPGLPEVGISEYDDIEREDGSFGLLNGEGTINRTFAPSLDAELPWRYTDYWVQSSVKEKHSNLVLNTKELELTFDMCADCPISGTSLTCPNGFTLSAGTTVCYNMTGTTSATSITTVTYLSLYNLENYKKQFQSFWIPFMEQFIPATTIWVAGERWCNEPCTIINPCDYDFELVEAEVSIETTPSIKEPTGGVRPKPKKVPSFYENIQLVSTDTTSYAERLINPPNIVQIEDVGLIRFKPLFRTFDDLSIVNKLEQYKQRFTAVTTKQIIE